MLSTGHDYSWFILNESIISREFALSGSEQNPDVAGKDIRKFATSRLSRRATGPVEAFKQNGIDFVVRDNIRDLVAGMNEISRGPMLDADMGAWGKTFEVNLTGPVLLAFAAVMGLSYLSTVPPTVGLVLKFFGPSNMALLFGIVMLSHQVGGFLGAWLGGQVFQATGSYDTVWIIDILLAVGAALVHLPIREAPVAVRPVPA